MKNYAPPFTMNETIAKLVGSIEAELDRVNIKPGKINPKLRKENRIKTIHSSLAIEANTLSLEQVISIIAGKRVLGNPNEIREVKNAYDAYELMLEMTPGSIDDLLRAHRLMMQGLIKENGKFRSEGVGIFDGDKLIHMAPPADLVAEEVSDLFTWYEDSDLHPLVKSSIFHYEFEFIHPFQDGNGRIGRLWHTVLLGAYNEVFYWLPVEELIQSRQKDYYDALATSDKKVDAAYFVELILELILEALKELEK